MLSTSQCYGTTSRGEVVFEKVTFSYGDEPVLTDFSLHANPGEVIALVGPSGAGKSTAAGLMARFYDPQQGSIMVDGYNLCDVSLDSLKKNLAFVDQRTFFQWLHPRQYSLWDDGC